MPLKFIIKDDSVIIKNINSLKDYFSPIKEIFNLSFYTAFKFSTFFLAMASLYYSGFSLASIPLIPFFFLFIIISFPYLFYLSSAVLVLIFFVIELFLFLFLIFTIRHLSNYPRELLITSGSISQKRFWIYNKKWVFKQGDFLTFSKRFEIHKYSSRTKIRCYWMLSRGYQLNYYIPFTFKFNSNSDSEIFEIANFIKKILAVPVFIQQHTLDFPINQQEPDINSNESVIKIKQLNDDITAYSLNIRPSKGNYLSIFYELFISISICIGIFKFFVNPGFVSYTSEWVLEFYQYKVILAVIFFPLFFLRFYQLLELFNSSLICYFNTKDNEFQISISRFLLTKKLYSGPIDKINQINLVNTNLKDNFSLEIDTKPELFIEYPLRYGDAMEYSLLINKKLSLLKM